MEIPYPDVLYFHKINNEIISVSGLPCLLQALIEQDDLEEVKFVCNFIEENGLTSDMIREAMRRSGYEVGYDENVVKHKEWFYGQAFLWLALSHGFYGICNYLISHETAEIPPLSKLLPTYYDTTTSIQTLFNLIEESNLDPEVVFGCTMNKMIPN